MTQYVVTMVTACQRSTDVMRHQLSYPATGAAAAILTLALIVCLNSQPSDAAVTGARLGTSDTDRYGNPESVIDGPTSRFEDHLFLLNGESVDDDDDDSVGLNGSDDGREDLGEVKRKWGQNNLALWGKRRVPYAENVDDLLTTKRKWGQKNMALWGKRASRLDAGDASVEKRKWGQKNMALWGRK